MNLKRNIIALITLTLALGVGLNEAVAQKKGASARRVQAELGAAFLDYQALQTGDLFDVNNFGAGINMGAHVYLNRAFNLTSSFIFAPELRYPVAEGQTVKTSLLDINAMARFKVNGLYREDAVVAPFVAAGIGLNSASNNLRAYLPLSLGLQLQLSENFALQFATTYKQGIGSGNIQHLAHSAGFIFGIPGTEPPRQRPNIVETIPSSQPKVTSADVAADSDGDGVPDRDDLCISEKGKAMYLGCPTAGGGSEAELPTDSWAVDEPQKPTTVDLRESFPGFPNETAINEQPVLGTGNNTGKKPFKKVATEDIERIQQAASRIYFNTGSAELTAESQNVLDEVAEILKRYPAYHLDVKGYTDNMGSDAKNTIIAIKRGFSVKKYLVYTHGIRYARIYSDGGGQDMDSEDASAQRRVEFRLIAPGQVGFRGSN